jgi:hypothetical protein
MTIKTRKKPTVKPTADQWTAILKLVRTFQEEDDKIDNAWCSLFELLASSNYPPAVEVTKVQTLIDVVKAVWGEKEAEDVSYWAYEVPAISDRGKVKVECVDKNGKKYDARKMDQYINFIMAY